MATDEIRAVVFDLFGTLIRNLRRPEFEEALAEVAVAVSVPSQSFIRLWNETWEKRSTGYFPSLEADVEYICRTLGTQPESTSLSGAAEMLKAFARRVLEGYRGDALETLRQLRESGYKTGLISNCAGNIPSVWGETPLGDWIDAPVFSCSVGVKKPAREIYLLASRGVGSRPEQCIFVADGNEKELTGASLAGMKPVLFLGPDEDPYDAGLDRKEWKGPAISELRGIFNQLTK
jgi:putative hydrolase of the HAD superfamily